METQWKECRVHVNVCNMIKESDLPSIDKALMIGALRKLAEAICLEDMEKIIEEAKACELIIDE